MLNIVPHENVTIFNYSVEKIFFIRLSLFSLSNYFVNYLQFASYVDQSEEGDQRFGRHKQIIGSPGWKSFIIGRVPDV